MSAMSTNHDNDDEETEEKEQPKPRSSDKDRALTRLQELKAACVVFQACDGIAEP